MRKLFTILAFTLFASVSFGQSNPNSNWPPSAGESSTACGVYNSLIQGAQGAGSGSPALSWPMNKVVLILREARPLFSGMNLGQMIQAYHGCGCVITYLGEGWFRVAIGGNSTVINMEDI
jgi:hypothetical protein